MYSYCVTFFNMGIQSAGIRPKFLSQGWGFKQLKIKKKSEVLNRKKEDIRLTLLLQGGWGMH